MYAVHVMHLVPPFAVDNSCMDTLRAADDVEVVAKVLALDMSAAVCVPPQPVQGTLVLPVDMAQLHLVVDIHLMMEHTQDTQDAALAVSVQQEEAWPLDEDMMHEQEEQDTFAVVAVAVAVVAVTVVGDKCLDVSMWRTKGLDHM